MEKNLLAQNTNTVSLLYIGPKPVKIDKVSGYYPQIRFKRNEPTEVPGVVASALLSFDCFALATDEAMQAAKDAEAKAAEAEKLAKEEAEKLAKQKEDEGDTVVMVDDTEVDLGKLTVTQIEAFIEGQELDVEKKSGELKPEFVIRVRDAYREKVSTEE